MNVCLMLALMEASLPAAPVAEAAVEPPLETWRYTGLYLARGTRTNVVGTSRLTEGQLVGRLFGPNGSTTDDGGHTYAEQRYLGFLEHAPAYLDGRAVLRLGAEVDFTFGDASNTSGANRGGAINGDTVNLQTKRLAVDVALGGGVRLVVGLQPLADSAHDPARAHPNTLLHGGTHLAFWGTDAAGANLFGRWGGVAARLGWFDLYANGSGDDDAQLFMADAEAEVLRATRVGLHAWWLRDRSRGAGTGPGSALATHNGASPLPLGPDVSEGDALWFAVDASYERWLAGGPVSVSGFAIANYARFEVERGVPDAQRSAEAGIYDAADADLVGLMADLEVGWRWGRTDGDVVTLEGLYASGDDRPDDRVLSNVLTGSSWGAPGALHATHRSLLLFPDARSVNRHVALVYDPANLGYGVAAGFANAAMDVIPHRLNVKLGAALAGAAAKPEGGERMIGLEGNLELVWRPMPLLWLGAHGAVVRWGRFLEGRVDERASPAARPWTTYLSLTWLQI